MYLFVQINVVYYILITRHSVVQRLKSSMCNLGACNGATGLRDDVKAAVKEKGQ
jgi:hypothetical protein